MTHLRVASPERLHLVELLVLGLGLLDLLLLLLLLGILVLDLLDLGLLLALGRLLDRLVVVNLLYKALELIEPAHICQRTFSTSLVTTSWMGYEMNSECFLTISLIRFSSR